MRAGQEVRVIDLPADAGAGCGIFNALSDDVATGSLADELKAASATHHGHALPAFLRALVVDQGKVRKTLAESQKIIFASLVGSSAAGQVRRVAERFALVGAAGELATYYQLTGWRTGEATRAAQACFSAWLAARGTEGASEPTAMLEQVRAFLSAHGESRFTDWSVMDDAPRTINRAGFRKRTDAGPVFYIEREAFRREVCAGFDPAAVAKTLVEASALVTGSNGEATRKERLPDGRSVRVYVVTSVLWAGA